MRLGNWRRANEELTRIRRLEAERNITGLIAELQSDAAYGRYSIVRSHAGDALGRLGDRRAVQPLIELARHDPEADARHSAIGALRKLKAHDAAPVFVEALKDPAPMVRGAAARALEDLGDPSAISILRTLLDTDPHPEVRLAAAEALVELGDKEVYARLHQVLRDVPRRVRGHPRRKRLKKLADIYS